MLKWKFRFIVGGILIILFIVGIVMLRNRLNPSFTVRMSSETVIKQVQSLNRLETASYTIEKVIDAGTSGSTFSDILFGDRILLVAHGQVIAGFDLSQIKKQNITITDRNLRLTLPAPQILITSLDNNETRVYDRRLGLLNKGDKDLESKTREKATEVIRSAACTGGILDEASRNARTQLTPLLKSLGYTTVTIDIPQGSC